jgi:hypothetical protein
MREMKIIRVELCFVAHPYGTAILVMDFRPVLELPLEKRKMLSGAGLVLDAVDLSKVVEVRRSLI